MGQFLLCAGAPGKRFALPHSRILMHQPSGQMQGQATDIAIQAEQIVYLKRMMAERIAFHTGQPIERIEADSDRDRWFTAEEAKDYGFIDQVIEHSTAAGRPAVRPCRELGRSVDDRAAPRPIVDRRRAFDRCRSRPAPVGRAERCGSAARRAGVRQRSKSGPGGRRPGEPLAALGRALARRELFVFLVRKEIKVKYKNSVLGFLWSMLNPALTLAVFFVLFTFFLRNGIPRLRHLHVLRPCWCGTSSRRRC